MYNGVRGRSAGWDIVHKSIPLHHPMFIVDQPELGRVHLYIEWGRGLEPRVGIDSLGLCRELIHMHGGDCSVRLSFNGGRCRCR